MWSLHSAKLKHTLPLQNDGINYSHSSFGTFEKQKCAHHAIPTKRMQVSVCVCVCENTRFVECQVEGGSSSVCTCAILSLTRFVLKMCAVKSYTRHKCLHPTISRADTRRGYVMSKCGMEKREN